MRPQPRQSPVLPAGVSVMDPGTAEKRGRFHVRAEGERGRIEIFDTIESGFSGRISDALRQIGNREVHLVINSRGGDLFEALGAFNLLVQHPGTVGVSIVGLAASAASLIAMAGQQIDIHQSAQVMVHNAQGLAIGDHNAMREAADIFEGFSATVRSIYAERTGQDEKTISRLMDESTWMDADKALELGFVDNIVNHKANSEETIKRKRALKAALRAEGLSRSQIRRAVWEVFGPDPAGDDDDQDLDVDRIAAALNSSFAAVEPYL